MSDETPSAAPRSGTAEGIARSWAEKAWMLIRWFGGMTNDSWPPPFVATMSPIACRVRMPLR